MENVRRQNLRSESGRLDAVDLSCATHNHLFVIVRGILIARFNYQNAVITINDQEIFEEIVAFGIANS